MRGLRAPGKSHAFCSGRAARVSKPLVGALVESAGLRGPPHPGWQGAVPPIDESANRRRKTEVTRTASAWIVLKFGGTSVSSLTNWRNIAKVATARVNAGARVLIVHSAVTGITDRLERLLDSALVRAHEDELRAIEERHHRLAAELGISIGDVEKHLQELRQIAAGVALVGEVSDRTRARVMATGELMATELGARFLRTQGLDVAWADARTMLRAEDRRSASAKASILSATCN